MDRLLITQALGLPPDTSLIITELSAHQWGQTLRFNGVAHADAQQIPFTLIFEDCRELRWQRYTHLDRPDGPVFPPTALVGLRLGRGQHRKPLHMLCEHFACILTYDTLHLSWPGNEAGLPLVSA